VVSLGVQLRGHLSEKVRVFAKSSQGGAVSPDDVVNVAVERFLADAEEKRLVGREAVKEAFRARGT